MHKGSAKALLLPLDLMVMSSSGDGGDEYQPGQWWLCAVYQSMRCTDAEH